jgi:hypothetical protein
MFHARCKIPHPIGRNITPAAIRKQRASFAQDGSPAQWEVELRYHSIAWQAMAIYAMTIYIDAAKIFLGRNESGESGARNAGSFYSRGRARLRRQYYVPVSA